MMRGRSLALALAVAGLAAGIPAFHSAEDIRMQEPKPPRKRTFEDDWAMSLADDKRRRKEAKRLRDAAAGGWR